jgi:hypothetical protein
MIATFLLISGNLIGFDNNFIIIQMYADSCDLRRSKVTFPMLLSCLPIFPGTYFSSLKTRPIMGFRRGLRKLTKQYGGVQRTNCQQKDLCSSENTKRTYQVGEPPDFRANYLDHRKIIFPRFTKITKVLQKISQNGSGHICFSFQNVTYVLFI